MQSTPLPLSIGIRLTTPYCDYYIQVMNKASFYTITMEMYTMNQITLTMNNVKQSDYKYTLVTDTHDSMCTCSIEYK